MHETLTSTVSRRVVVPNVKNRYFDEQSLAVLLNTPRWRLVTSLFAPDILPLHSARLRRWAETNTGTHAHQEVIIVLSGKGYFGYKGEIYPCRPGDIFFMDSEDAHSYPYPKDYPDCDHFLVQVAKDTVLFRTFSWRGGRELPVRTPNRVLTGAVAAHLLQECVTLLRRTKDLPRHFHRHSLVSVLGLLVAEIVQQGYKPEADAREATHERIVATVRQHICDTLGRGVHLDGLATLTGYSKYHLLRVFKACAGETINEYLQTVRIAAVKDFLAKGRSKKELSSLLGFSSTPAFSRWLRAHCPALLNAGARKTRH